MTLRTLRKALSTRKTSSRTTKSPTHQMGAMPPKKKNQRHSSKFWTSACATEQEPLCWLDSHYNVCKLCHITPLQEKSLEWCTSTQRCCPSPSPSPLCSGEYSTGLLAGLLAEVFGLPDTVQGITLADDRSDIWASSRRGAAYPEPLPAIPGVWNFAAVAVVVEDAQQDACCDESKAAQANKQKSRRPSVTRCHDAKTHATLCESIPKRQYGLPSCGNSQIFNTTECSNTPTQAP